MTKQKSTKRALLLSALSLLMCVSMLIGSTFAWFTDSVTSGSNIIKSGNLDVEMYWADGTKAVPTADADWTDASNGAIFDYDLWEPGYTEVRHIKIANEGTLALKYQLSIAATGEVSELADVIDVYYVDPAVQVADRTDLTEDMKLGTLSDVLDKISTTASGNLEAGQSHTVTLALKMQESAGNEYQNKSIGSSFEVKLSAIQLNFENDSFGPDYDEGLDPEINYVSTAAQLQAALKNSGRVVLMDDISLDSSAEFMATNGNGSLLYLDHVDVTLDLNGHDIVAEADAVMTEGKAPNALILVRYSTLNIVGEGSLITKNKSMPVYGWAHSEINIYGGTFKGNAYERNESDVYVNNDNVTINVYGGDFSDSVYAFNAHDTYANAPVIILHEGITYKDFLKNGTTNVIANDINRGRIVLADDMYLKTHEENGETVHEVAKKQENEAYIGYVKYDTIAEAIEAAKDGDTISLAKGTFYEALDLQGKALTIQGAGKGATIIAGPEDYTTANIPKQTWAGWGQDANVYALISANKNVTVKDLTVSANPTQIGEVGEFRYQGDCAFVGIHVQSANAMIENVDIKGIKPDTVTGNDHHNFGLYITSAIGDTKTYTATYKNGTVSDVNRGGIYCWSGNYTLNFENVTVIGPGNIDNPNGTLTPAAGSESNKAIYAFSPFYVCSPATYENVVVRDSWCVEWWGGASWAWANSAWSTNPPAGVTCINCGTAN